MKIAFSPCPNDTFIFHAMVHGLVSGAPAFDVQYADIDQTNGWATRGDGPDLVKVSYGALPWIHADYRLLRCGGALGRGCGPLVLTRGASDWEAARASGRAWTVAVPSERSTAYVLFRLWVREQFPEMNLTIRVMPFHEIMPSVQAGSVDAGLVIHEARFTFQALGLHQSVDLGTWWEGSTGLPIPLGAILVKKAFDARAVTQWIQTSVRIAWEDPGLSATYVAVHAKEMQSAVCQAHIDLYVNAYSEWVDEQGMAAVRTLFERGKVAGLFPDFDLEKMLVEI